MTYKDAGVDIEKKDAAFRRIKQKISGTNTPEVITDVGLFGGFYQFPSDKFKKPVLVSSADGVGTKIKVAFMANKHDTVGQDLVNHCINDIACCGAKPLFFLDYFACGKLDPQIYEQVLNGITYACKQAQIPLIGGETAEMPDFYQESEYDLAGTIVGAVDKTRIIDGSRIEKGDVLIGVSSNGLHTNGFTLARKVLFYDYKLDDHFDELGCTLGEELLKVHTNYYPLISQAVDKFDIRGIVHVTGGGIVKNSQRLLPDYLSIEVDWDRWDAPMIFQLIQKAGNVPEADMKQTFNMGVGLILILNKQQKKELLEWGREIGFELFEMGATVGK